MSSGIEQRRVQRVGPVHDQTDCELPHRAERSADLQPGGHRTPERNQQPVSEQNTQSHPSGVCGIGRLQWRRDQEPLCLSKVSSAEYQAVGERRRIPV